MIIDCPHCHGRIMARSDGTCPSCGGNTRERSSSDPDIVQVSIREGVGLPANCAKCCQATEDVTAIVRRGRNSSAPEPNGDRALILSWAFGIIGLLAANWFGAGKKKLSFRIPLCALCKTTGPIEVCSVDFETHELTFLGHRRFRQLLLDA